MKGLNQRLGAGAARHSAHIPREFLLLRSPSLGQGGHSPSRGSAAEPEPGTEPGTERIQDLPEPSWVGMFDRPDLQSSHGAPALGLLLTFICIFKDRPCLAVRDGDSWGGFLALSRGIIFNPNYFAL